VRIRKSAYGRFLKVFENMGNRINGPGVTNTFVSLCVAYFYNAAVIGHSHRSVVIRQGLLCEASHNRDYVELKIMQSQRYKCNDQRQLVKIDFA